MSQGSICCLFLAFYITRLSAISAPNDDAKIIPHVHSSVCKRPYELFVQQFAATTVTGTNQRDAHPYNSAFDWIPPMNCLQVASNFNDALEL